MSNTHGISLIEVIITVGLLLIVGGALIQLGVVALGNSDASQMRSIALKQVDESLEIARAFRDSNPTGFLALSGNYAVNATKDGFISTDCNPLVTPFSPPGSNPCTVVVEVGNSNVNFYRVVRIVNTAGVPNSKDVIAYVFWNNRGNYSNVIASTILTRWQN